MTLKDQYAARRAAHRFVAQNIHRALDVLPWVNEPGWPAIAAEAQRIQRAHEAAGAIEDGPFEAESKPPTGDATENAPPRPLLAPPLRAADIIAVEGGFSARAPEARPGPSGGIPEGVSDSIHQQPRRRQKGKPR